MKKKTIVPLNFHKFFFPNKFFFIFELGLYKERILMKRLLSVSVLFLMIFINVFPLDFRNLGPNVNSDKDEFLPVVYNDTMYFRRTISKNPEDFRIFNIALSDLTKNGAFAQQISIQNMKDYGNSTPPIDSKESTLPPVSFDPSTPGFYSFSSERLNQYKLAQPKKVDNVNTQYNDMHPAISPDGSFIVFSSDRPKKAGQAAASPDMDLFITYRQPDNSWSKPTNLGKEINTKENDISPFIAPDGTLYYSSKGFVRDSVTIVFSGQAKLAKANKSDVFMIVERPNYNIIKAEPTGNKKVPFKNPQILPPPYNTEFNEIGPTIWKDTLIFLASDRLRPYDRPDPLNQEGYDLYGFVSDSNATPPPYFEFTDSIPFFVTGYYFPNTKKNLNDLIEKIHSKKLRNNGSSRYIADPENENDENGKKINYFAYTPRIERLLDSATEFIDKWLEYLDRNPNGEIEIKVVGFADSRLIMKSARYVEENINDKEFNYSLDKDSQIDNFILSDLRAYKTAMNLRKKVAENSRYAALSGRIRWTCDGKGVYEGKIPELFKRKVVIIITLKPEKS